ncbi:hypothetical protein NKH19_25270 [Mesorhizobium sp. M1338]|uniref:hypothetical protein n=1 Tax=unclassified Mesorhizobium TaxID=325217 RepID=UPI003338A657
MRKPITIDQFDALEVDDIDGRLYWMGKGVVLERKLTLDWYQTFLATIAAFGALLAGIYPFGTAWGWW